MKTIFGNGCAKGCFILLALLVLVVVVTTMGAGGLRARFGVAEVQGNKPGMAAQDSGPSAAPKSQPQPTVKTAPDVGLVPDGAGGGGPTATAVSAPPPPITQPEPQPAAEPQTVAAIPQPIQPIAIENQSGTITGDSTASFYIVQSGDTVWQIAQKFGVDMDQIRDKNSIEENLIYPGQVVYLPDPGSTTTGAESNNGSGGVSPDTAGAQGQDPQVPTMPNTGITSRRP